MDDERFSRITKDPKLRRVPKKEQKVKIDRRFQSMFKDKKFKEECVIDERGRPVHRTASHDLKRYYHQSTSEESSSDSEEDENQAEHSKQLKETIKGDKKISEVVKKKLKNLKVDYARGEHRLFSESSSDDESSSGEQASDDDGIEHKWGQLDAEADTTEEVTRRLAVCNMDWDRIRAVDIMVLLNSFLSPGGVIESVKIYLSEFGKKRLSEEDVSGPPELRESKVEEDEEEKEEGSKYHMEKLRQYQLNRLKYYYAVITFNNEKTANKIYTECDGIEYESSANKIDLRFIPDEMIFNEEPKESCEKMPDMTKYQPRFFTTTALQQAKVDLTWDETNPDRIELTQKINKGKLKLEEIDDAELKNFVALSEEEDEESEKDDETEKLDTNDNDNPIEKYRALLLDIEEKEKQKQDEDIQMEVTWGLELEKKSEELVKKKIAEKEDKTPFEKFLDKRKEKRKEKKKIKKQQNCQSSNEDSDDNIPSDVDMNDPYFAEEFKDMKTKKKKRVNHDEDNEEEKQREAELELLLMNNEDSKKHFSLKQIQEQGDEKKGKKIKKKNVEKNDEQAEDDFEIKVDDPRFSAVFSSHHYNIDPSDSHFKKTKGMERFIEEKMKRRANDDEEVISKKSKIETNKKNVELSCLVKSIKRKTEAFKKK